MFDFALSEVLVVVVVAMVVIGPKELPRLLYIMGQWVGKARRFVAQFQSQIEEMGRESEVTKLREELELANQKLVKSGIDPTLSIHNNSPTPPPAVAVVEKTRPKRSSAAKPKPKPKTVKGKNP
ncbi:MAG: hypothetical protein QM523_00830 [Candidatus Pacebacteria bacterium]|nr:hypothetical protein [Candidatus Paceibacterota bacterium]